MNILGFPWTIRTRLSLLYAGAFFLAGFALIAFMYLFLGQVLAQQFMIRADVPIDPGAPATLLGPSPGPPVEGTTTVQRVIDIMFRRVRIDTLRTMLIASSIIVVALTGLAGLIGWLVAGQALEPLRNITATARRVADRSLHEQIALAGPKDEIKDLADTLDAMLERLDRSFDSQRRFVANASHELRTPLTIARTLIEVAMLEGASDEKVRRLGTTLLEVNQRHERLTEGLLTLASSDKQTADFHPVDLSDIAGHVVSDLLPLAEKAHIALAADLQAGFVLGEPFLLERLIRNLVENAIQYNVAERGMIHVATTASAEFVELIIGNTGPIVPAYEVPGLFEPFCRLAGTEWLAGVAGAAMTRGAGLGLSIVRSVTLAHGGQVEASPREGGGLTVHVLIPTAAE